MGSACTTFANTILPPYVHSYSSLSFYMEQSLSRLLRFWCMLLWSSKKKVGSFVFGDDNSAGTHIMNDTVLYMHGWCFYHFSPIFTCQLVLLSNELQMCGLGIVIKTCRKFDRFNPFSSEYQWNTYRILVYCNPCIMKQVLWFFYLVFMFVYVPYFLY